MQYLQIVLSAVISFGVLFLLTKLIGYRQVSELSMFDYINSITIGSIAAETAFSSGKEIFEPLIAMVIFALLSLLFSFLTDKSVHARRFISGEPIVLLHGGKIFRKNFQRARLDLNEFLSACRIGGYYDISELDTAILEPNGKISFLPAEKSRPSTPSDLGLSPAQKPLCANVILDGKIMAENLKNAGYNEEWLKKQLGSTAPREVFLGIVSNGSLRAYLQKSTPGGDIFE